MIYEAVAYDGATVGFGGPSMFAYTIIAFVFLFLQAEQPGEWVIVPQQDVAWTISTVLGQPVLLALVAFWAARRAGWLLRSSVADPERVQLFHHRVTFTLRVATLIGFGATVFLTRWPEWMAFGRVTPVLQIVGDLVVLLPFVLNLMVIWIVSYPTEKALRAGPGWDLLGGESGADEGWRLRAYLDFHLRHYVLVVAAPMLLILFAANLTQGYEATLHSWTGWVWTADAVLAAIALGVFVMAPPMLCRIWRTDTLQPGTLRDRLEATCARIGLKFRDIRVWKTDGIMINAAAMGLFGPVRYVLLSDALLATMTPEQIEAVFGHEVGHIRHRHIPLFLVFAAVGWFIVAGILELLIRMSTENGGSWGISIAGVEVIGVVLTVLIWVVGFGWISRRFEWQADLFGAQCVTPPPESCALPCSVHLDGHPEINGAARVCMTGATVFASALDRVAILNGIPHEERSWRHSSIANRIRFLMSMAGDPSRAARFDRTLRRLRATLTVAAVLGGAAVFFYWLSVSEPAILRLSAGTM